MKVMRIPICLALFALLCAENTAAADRKPSNVSNPWLLEAALTATDNPLQLGFSIGIDGDTIVATGAGTGTGVYVYTRSREFWTSTATPTAELTVTDNSFVYATAISGNVIVAGAYGADGTGAVYVFVEPAGGWTNMTETAKLTASDAISGDFVGYTVAISGNTIVVGAPENNEIGSYYPEPNGPGAAYVYEKPAAGWTNMTETAKLTASDGVAGDDFGWSVAIQGNTIVAGAPDATMNSYQYAGAVYLFQKSGAQWTSGTQTAKLTGSDAGYVGSVGESVRLNGNTVAAAGIKDLYLFEKPATGWTDATQTAELGDTSAYFFNSVAICGPYVLGGSPYGNKPKGLVYVEPSGGWSNMTNPTNVLSTPPNHGNGLFGWSAAIQGTTLVLGSETNGGGGGNTVYVYGPK